jgi:phage head maturation protease
VADSTKPYGDVTYADPKNGKYPIDTEAHAKAAWSYINVAKNAAQYPMNGVTLSEVKDRIMAACRKFGIDVADGDTDSEGSGDSGRAESLASYVRSFPLEDVSVRTTRDGRIVDAYLAVFDTPAEIHDQDGHYEEELDPVVFNRAISDARPQGSRTSWRVGVFYNHGLTIMGTPSDRHSMPVAVPLDIKTDAHGVRATDKYHRSQFCDEIVEGLESGAIPGYSFSGRFLRSNPLIPRAGFRQRPGAPLPKVRRMESTLREYGPTPFPAYADAAVLGIRSDSLMAAMMNDPETAMRMLAMFRGGAPQEADSPPPSGAPHPGDSPAEDSRPRVRSGRPIREQVQRNAALLLQGQYRR